MNRSAHTRRVFAARQPLDRPLVRPLLIVLLLALAWTLATADVAIRL